MGSFFQLLHSTRGKEAKKATSSQLINTRSISILPPDMLKLELNGIKPPPLSHQDLLVHTPRTRTPHTRPSSNGTHTHINTYAHPLKHSHALTSIYSKLIRSAISCYFSLTLSFSDSLSHALSLTHAL